MADEDTSSRAKKVDEHLVSLALAPVEAMTARLKATTDKDIDTIQDIIREIEHRTSVSEATIAVLKSMLNDIKSNMTERFTAQREAVSLALAAAKETTAIAQQTADKAVAKAEAAAGKEYLESQIEGLRSSFSAQIIAQKEAINAALVAAKDALTAALASAEKAIAKAEQASDKRFESVNEFRQTLSDQTGTFIPRNEYQVQTTAFIDRLTSLERSRSEDQGKLRVSERTTDRSTAVVSQIIAAAVAAVVVIGGVVSAVAFLSSRGGSAVTSTQGDALARLIELNTQMIQRLESRPKQ